MVEMARQPYDYPGQPDSSFGAIEPTLFPEMQLSAGLEQTTGHTDAQLPPGAEERRDRARAMRYHLSLMDGGQIELFSLVRSGTETIIAPNPDLHVDSHS